MMVGLKLMAYFKISLSTRKRDSAKKWGNHVGCPICIASQIWSDTIFW